jgi:hypothetical protein
VASRPNGGVLLRQFKFAGSSGPGCGLWFVVGGPAGVGSWGCRIQCVRAIPLLVEVVARRDRFAAVDGSLLLQTGGLSRFDVGFCLSGAGFGGGLVGEGFVLFDLQRFLPGALADLVCFDVAMLVAFVACHPRESCDEQDGHDRGDDDQNCCAGSYIGSLCW